MEWIIFFILALAIVTVALYTSLDLHISYIFQDGRDDFRVKFYLFRVVKIYQTTRQGILQNAIVKIIGKFIPSARPAFHRPNPKEPKLYKLPWICRSLSVKIQLGLGDAAYTAIGFGVLQGICPLLKQYFATKIRWMSPPVICIEPDFQKNVQRLFFQCILSVKIGHLFYILKNTSQKQEG